MTDKPKSFDDLEKSELYRSAIEDFAVDVDEKDSAKVIKAALLESGVKWADYVKQHPEVVPEKKENVITTTSTPGTSKPVPVPEPDEPVEEARVIVAEQPNAKPSDQYLIKMVRDNPQFNTRGYKFTQDHPYALVDARNAQWILANEEGFRQAFPNELSEFYG